jgi:hypothetical protein
MAFLDNIPKELPSATDQFKKCEALLSEVRALEEERA